MTKIARAVFLDRDGVINKLVFNPATGCYESPHTSKDFSPIPDAAEAMITLQMNDYLLIIVSNQPSWAKKKTTHENLVEINNNLLQWLAENNINVARCYYCYHHPEAVVPELKQECTCRKPGTLFLKEAEKEFNIELKDSWFIGDRATDIECGRQVGCRTILIESEENTDPVIAAADYCAKGIMEASKIITGKQ